MGIYEMGQEGGDKLFMAMNQVETRKFLNRAESFFADSIILLKKTDKLARRKEHV